MGPRQAVMILSMLLVIVILPSCLAVFEHEDLLPYLELDEAAEHKRSLLQELSLEAVANLTEATKPKPLPSLPFTPAAHCILTSGSWCGPYYRQNVTQRPAPKRGNSTCPKNCSGVGQCQYDFGICYCPAGYGGVDCSQARKRPCWRMGSDKRDLGWLNYTEWTHSRCAGICDDSNAMCYCPPETKFGRIDAAPGSPLGTPPIRAGRPMFWCQPSSDEQGNKVMWGAVKYEDLLGPNGWCNGDVPSFMCPCRLDGRIGNLCNIVVEQFCVNQCSGRGECDQGFCKCHDGWYGHDCSRQRAGLPMSTPPDFKKSKLWLEPAVTPALAAEDPPQTRPERRRPYIYVYDVKPEFSTDILQFRIERAHCNYRMFQHGNVSSWIGYNAYALESVLHELFLTTEHRTFDPEEADYFYVPIMWACLFDVYGWNPIPRWPADVHGPRPYGAAMMQREAARWLNTTFPWFARRGGRDHIWFTATDEGACYVFKEVWPGVMLSHWGRTDFPHLSGSQYHADNYSSSIHHKDHDGEWLDLTSRAHPCFDPRKDLVIPAFKRAEHFKQSPYMGMEAKDRSIFIFFRGDLRMAPGQDPQCKYSRCIRQRLFNLSQDENWREKYNVMLGDSRTVQGDYSALLSMSLFCLVPPGDGWSPRLEDAVLHGCIPVIIMDGVQVVFESILDMPSFSIRILEKDLAQIITILKAVPQDRILKMQENLAKVWHRFRYLGGIKMLERDADQVVNEQRQQFGGFIRPNPGAQYATSAVDDAFSTIMQWLYTRIPEVHEKSAAAAGVVA